MPSSQRLKFMPARLTGALRSARMRLAYVDIAREASRDPILMFMMGKTGTTALGAALPEATGRPVHKLHRITRAGIHQVRYQLMPPGAPIMHRHLVGHYWRNRLRFDSTRRDVITAVREPIGHVVSRFFQGGEGLGFFSGDPDPQQDLRPLVAHFEEYYSRNSSWDFFDEEIKAGLGVDLYAHPFPTAEGALTVETDRFRVFVYRFEDLAKVAAGPLPAFLGCAAPIELPRSNVGAEKSYAALYKRFRNEAVLPGWILDQAYEKPMATHFYTEEEREAYRRRWSR